MNFLDVSTYIRNCGDIDELRQINQITVEKINFSRHMADVEAKSSLYTGQKVKINEAKVQKEQYIKNKADRLAGKIGKIIKINRTKAKVDFDDGRIWNVSFAILEPAE